MVCCLCRPLTVEDLDIQATPVHDNIPNMSVPQENDNSEVNQATEVTDNLTGRPQENEPSRTRLDMRELIFFIRSLPHLLCFVVLQT